MWQRVVWITLLVGYSSAGVASWSEDISVHNNAAVTGIHYSQHESSVNAARKAAAERLHQQQTAALVATGSSSTGPCDTLCYNSFTSASEGASDAETIGQGIVGFTSPGTSASSVGSSQKYSASSSRMSESSVQNMHGTPVIYPAVGASTSGTRSSYTSSSSSRQQQQLHGSSDYGRTHSGYVQPVHYTVPAPQTSVSSFNERSSSERSSVIGGSRPIVANVVYTPVPVAGSSGNSFNTRSSFASSSANEQQVVQPVVYPVANNDYTRRYVVQQDHQYRANPSNTYVVYTKPISSTVQHYGPSRSRTEGSTSSTSYDASGRVLNVNVAPAVHSERTVDEQRTEQRSESVQTLQRQPDLYPAVRGSFDHQERELDEQQYGDEIDGFSTERSIHSGSATSSSQRRAEQQSTGSYVRTGSYVPSAGASHNNRYSSSQTADSQRRQTYHSSAPGYVAVPVGGVASSKYESESQSQHQQQQRQHIPIVVQPVPVGASSTSSSRYSSSAHEQRSNSLLGTGTGSSAYYVPAGSTSYNSQHSTNSRYKSGSGAGAGGFVHYPITNDEYGRRFGAGRTVTSDTDLHDIMSESETLARLQAQNVHNGAVAGSGTFDTDSRFGGDSESSLGTMPGGFQRTKSWSSSSKWASEQRYGDDGKPKTYSMLSTAESEKHNVNGKTTGYKAATTTLEDDGKVSTYSLHTT